MPEPLSQISADLDGMDTRAYVDKLNGGSNEMGLGDAGENSDELDQLHGEYAEIGSPADEEATRLRVKEYLDGIKRKSEIIEVDDEAKEKLLVEFLMKERAAAAQVAERLTVARGVSNAETFVESMRRAGATDDSLLADKH